MAAKSGGSLTYNLADIEDYLLKTDILLKLCSDINDLNKLYRKSFKKIETYDEEEECTVTPDACNGYTFELYINSFFQFCESNKFGVFVVDKSEEFAPIKNEGQVELAQYSIYSISQKYLQKVLNEENKDKFKDKNVEINFLKTQGC